MSVKAGLITRERSTIGLWRAVGQKSGGGVRPRVEITRLADQGGLAPMSVVRVEPGES
jgi:hypothetical protein